MKTIRKTGLIFGLSLITSLSFAQQADKLGENPQSNTIKSKTPESISRRINKTQDGTIGLKIKNKIILERRESRQLKE